MGQNYINVRTLARLLDMSEQFTDLHVMVNYQVSGLVGQLNLKNQRLTAIYMVEVKMIIKSDNLYTFSQAAQTLGVTPQRLFELSASQYVEKVHQENRIFFTKESIRKLVLRGDI